MHGVASRRVACWRGSEPDVLDRILGAARRAGAEIVLRLTADCPLLDPQVCGEVLALLRRAGADYASNVEPRSWPDGLDCEAVTLAALETAGREAAPGPDREHVTPFVRRQQQRFAGVKGLEVGAEFATQTGEVNGADIPIGDTYALHAHAQYNLESAAGSFVRAEYNNGSGNDPATADNERFANP